MPAIYSHTQLTRQITKEAAAWVRNTFGQRRKYTASEMECAYLAGSSSGMHHAVVAMGAALMETSDAAE